MKNNLLKTTLLFLSISFFKVEAFADKSKDGDELYPKGTYRAINIFVNIIYDVTSSSNPLPAGACSYWDYYTTETINQSASYPTYINDFCDQEYTNSSSITNMYTRYFYEASLGNLIMLGDNIVVNIKQSTIENYLSLSSGASFNAKNLAKAVINFLNDNTTNGLVTINNYSSLSDFDLDGDDKIDLVNILIRNSSPNYGELINGGYQAETTQKLKLNGTKHSINAYTIQGQTKWDLSTQDGFRCGAISHEIAHTLLGNNIAHTNGFHAKYPGSNNTFLANQEGHSLFGCKCVNGYERWRLDWLSSTYNTNSYTIAASNKESDVIKSEGEQTFTLRDFITTGDAIRIKLPYIDEGAPNQYIWIEYHNVGSNGKVDIPKYETNYPCRESSAGIYMYYQVGWDALEYTNLPNYSNFLKPITAEGNFDWERDKTDLRSVCIVGSDEEYPLNYQVYENPFCGASDMEYHYFQDENEVTFDLIYGDRAVWQKRTLDGTESNNLSSGGDADDAFTGTTSINIGTNPAPVNTVTCINEPYKNNGVKYIKKSNVATDNTTIYLSGLSINMSKSSGGYKVNIKWDDYDIDNDTRWTGIIVANEDININSGNIVTLAQNKTPIQFTKEDGYFSPKTTLTCRSGANLTLNAASVISLIEESKLIIEDGASLLTEGTSTLSIKDGSELNISKNGYFCCNYPTSIYISSNSTFSMDGFAFENGDIIYESDITLNSSTSVSRYLTNGNISTSSDGYTVASSDDVVLAAPSITLSSGFHACSGSSFQAKALNLCAYSSSSTKTTTSSSVLDDKDLPSFYSETIENENVSFVMYPNPTKNIFTIEIVNQIEDAQSLTIYNSESIVLVNLTSGIKNKNQIDCSFWPSGVYLVRLITKKGAIITKKLIKY